MSFPLPAKIFAELENGSIREYSLLPQDLGFEPAPLSAVGGGVLTRTLPLPLRILSGARGGPSETWCF